MVEGQVGKGDGSVVLARCCRCPDPRCVALSHAKAKQRVHDMDPGNGGAASGNDKA